MSDERNNNDEILALIKRLKILALRRRYADGPPIKELSEWKAAAALEELLRQIESLEAERDRECAWERKLLSQLRRQGEGE